MKGHCIPGISWHKFIVINSAVIVKCCSPCPHITPLFSGVPYSVGAATLQCKSGALTQANPPSIYTHCTLTLSVTYHTPECLCWLYPKSGWWERPLEACTSTR